MSMQPCKTHGLLWCYDADCEPPAPTTPKVEVGQVWRDRIDNEDYRITNVDANGVCFTFRIFAGSMGWPLWRANVASGRFTLLRDVAHTPPAPKACDCGGAKARTTHSSWCSTVTP